MRRRGAGTPGTPLGLREWSGDGLPSGPSLLAAVLEQNPVSLALRRALGSPCRRFWSESNARLVGDPQTGRSWPHAPGVGIEACVQLPS